jgi:phospholipase/lecithinase/hemolysin
VVEGGPNVEASEEDFSMSQNSSLPTYSAAYAFGDSLSDAGNLSISTSLAGLTTPISPPYYKEQYGLISGNVFSNGPTWVQNLSTALGLGTLAPSLAGGTDFAYGGAETGSTPQNADLPAYAAISLPAQLSEFQTQVPHPSANALYTLSVGANDIDDILATTTLTAQQQTTDVNDAVANEIAFVNHLIGDGAKNLLVLDVPDLGKIPEITEGLDDGSDTPSGAYDAQASQLASEYNTALNSQLAAITGTSVHVVNTFTLLDDAIADPAAYGLTNVTTPVWDGNFTSASSGTLAATTTAGQDQYLFWDAYHPTETGHQAIAAAASTALSGETNLDGSAAQYVVADDGGALYIQDTVSGPDGTQVLPGVNVMQFTNGMGVFDPSGAAEDVARLYGAAMERAPDIAGLKSWTAEIDDAHVSLAAVANSFASSPEFIQDYGSLSNAAFVNQLYENVLGRPADAAGAQSWDGALASGASRGALVVGFAQSEEYEADTISTAGDVNNAETNRLYQAALDRAPDVAGLTSWSSALANGATPTQVAQDFINSAEFQQDYGTLSASDFVSTLYENALHRAADPAGLQFWSNALQQGMSEASVIVGFSDSLENRVQTAGATHANWVFIPT